MLKRFRAGLAGLVLAGAIAAAALIPGTAVAAYNWGCPGIAWSSASAPQANTCTDTDFYGSTVYAVSEVRYGYNYGFDIAANAAGGTPYKVYIYDANTGISYGPWNFSDTNGHAIGFPDATTGHYVYPLIANTSSNTNNPNHYAKDYYGAFLGCDLVNTCTAP